MSSAMGQTPVPRRIRRSWAGIVREGARSLDGDTATRPNLTYPRRSLSPPHSTATERAMLTVHEQRLLVHYLANAASCLHHRDREAKELAEWITDNGNRTLLGSGKRASRAPGRRRKRSRALPASLGHNGPDLDDLLDPEELQALEDCADGPTGRLWWRLGEALRSKCAAAKSARGDRTAQRLRCLGRTMELNRADIAILELMLRYHTQPMIDDVFGHASFRGSPLNLKGPALSALHRASGGARGPRRPDPRRLRCGAQESRGPVLPGGAGDARRHAVRRVRRQAGPPAGDRLSAAGVNAADANVSGTGWRPRGSVIRGRHHD